MRLSPLNQRRWRNFKANRRAVWSLGIFLVLFVVSLMAEVVANDKPIVVSYRGGLHFRSTSSIPKPHSAAISGPKRSTANRKCVA